MAQQYRFWAHENDSPVRLTVSEDRPIHWWYHQLDEEGFTSRAVDWSIENGQLVCESYTRARDCDGLIEYGHKVVCPLADLDNGNEVDGIADAFYPKWQREDAGWQRDHSAEAMGY
jgi:hypothetical protein